MYNNTLREIVTDPAAVYPIMRMGIGNVSEHQSRAEYGTIISVKNHEIEMLKEMNKLYKERILAMEKLIHHHGLSSEV